MEQDQTNGNADQETQVNDEAQGSNDQVSYDSYRRVVGKLKKRDTETAELKARLEALETEKLESSGQKEELINKLKEDQRRLREDLKATKSNYAWRSITSSIKDEATKHGCSRPDVLIKLMGKEQLSGLIESVDQDFNVDGDTLKSLIDDAKNSYADLNLFGGKSVNHTPASPSKPRPPEAPDTDKMSATEYREHIKELARKGQLEL